MSEVSNMEDVRLWLEGLLDSHVRPDPKTAAFHRSILDRMVQEMTERLPEINNIFDGVQLEMAGSVLNDTKVGDSDEFDVNVVIKLPFDESDARLLFDKSSPGYALLHCQREETENVQTARDIFVKQDNLSFVSADKLDQSLRMAIFQELNSLNTQSNGSGNLKENFSFDCDSCPEILVYRCDEGWEYVVHPKKFHLDLATCIQLPVSVLKGHPTIPNTLARLLRVFPEIEEEKFVRLVPKSSPRFSQSQTQSQFFQTQPIQNSCILTVPLSQRDFSKDLRLSDWVLGFGGIENHILAKFDTPCKCLMLLKYMINNHKDLPLWSYYLKTLVVQMVIDRPDKDFWSNQNLFLAFKPVLRDFTRQFF